VLLLIAVDVLGFAAKGAPLVEIAVQDSGPGIPVHVRENVFVPFFTTKERGTGLGLAISQRVVQEMGGWIEVASEVGAGAIFTIVLAFNLLGDALRDSLDPKLKGK
jgi:signal transduction histidine kinase